MPEHVNEVQLVVKQGEDYTAEIIWVSDEGENVPVCGPGRLEIRSTAGDLLAFCEDSQEEIESNRGYLALSTSSGVIHIYLPKYVTEQIPVGHHVWDVFVNYQRYTNINDLPPTWGDFHTRAPVSGTCIVHPAVTENIPSYPQTGRGQLYPLPPEPI